MVDSRWQCEDGESVNTAYDTSSYGLAVQVDDSISFRMGLLDDGSRLVSIMLNPRQRSSLRRHNIFKNVVSQFLVVKSTSIVIRRFETRKMIFLMTRTKSYRSGATFK